MLTMLAMAIHRMGATARSKLKVNMVGTTIAISANVLPMAPMPTVRPPKHPTTNKIMAIHPNRLNSISLINLSIIAFNFNSNFEGLRLSFNEKNCLKS